MRREILAFVDFVVAGACLVLAIEYTIYYLTYGQPLYVGDISTWYLAAGLLGYYCFKEVKS